jgi:Spy/CpxP family protein refolding chaperone
MRSMKFAKLLVILTMTAVAGLAIAQPPSMPENGPMREKVRERLKTMKIWKLTEEVGLSSEQSEKFFPLYNRHEKAIEEIDARRGELINRLERLANSQEASDKEISELSDQLESFPRSMMEERARFFKEAGSILGPRQLAKLMVFEERFRERLQQFVRDIRREGRGKGMRD